GAIIWTGALADPDGHEGTAHLFEHLPFRGTEKYPQQTDIASIGESHGASIRAHTGGQRTTFRSTRRATESLLAWDLLDQLIFHPAFNEEALETERPAIVAEIAEHDNDNPTEDLLHILGCYYGAWAAKKMLVLGDAESLARITAADLEMFHAKHYRPANMTFLAFGNLSHLPTPWPEFLASQLSDIPAERSERQALQAKVGNLPALWVSDRKPVQHPEVAVGTPLHRPGTRLDRPYVSDYEAELAVINKILTSGMSSVLFEELRVKRGLVYGVDSDHAFFDRHIGVWGLVFGVTQAKNVDPCLTVIHQVLEDQDTFSANRVEAAKEDLLAGFDMHDHAPRDHFHKAEEDLVSCRRILTKNDLVSTMEQVTRQGVLDVVREIQPEYWVQIIRQAKE
ncbi:MAG: insulinase family protein, partial [Candidatus Kerfeldbacteria bacterium]|nr:insulinase family protein [Candidatus Kerfeldbacteria bacterium]